MEKIKMFGEDWYVLSEEEKQDKNFVIDAIEKEYVDLRDIDNIKLFDDKDVVAAAIKKGFALQDASERLQRDRDLATLHAKHNGLPGLPKYFENDKVVILHCVIANRNWAGYIGENLQKDDKYREILRYLNGEVKLKDLPEECFVGENKECLEIVNSNKIKNSMKSQINKSNGEKKTINEIIDSHYKLMEEMRSAVENFIPNNEQ